MREPVKNAAIALGLHLIALLVMMFGLHLGIYAVVYSNALFAFFMCLFNAMSLRKYSGYRQEVVKTFLIPVAASAIMGVVVFGVYKGIFAVIKVNAIAAILAIVIGAVVYGAMLLLLKGLSEEELKKFEPSMEIEEAEDAIYNRDLTDMMDILQEMLKESRR